MPLGKKDLPTTEEIERVVTRMRRIAIGSVGLSALTAYVWVFTRHISHNQPGFAFTSLPMLLLWSIAVSAYAVHSLYQTAVISAAKFRRQIIIHELTGVLNYHYMAIRLSEECERSRRYGTVTSLLYMDLDHFKRVNDRFGHHVGNIVLHELATLIGNDMRKSEVLGRWGGDEFLAILRETVPQTGKLLAERLLNVVKDYSLDLEERGRVDCLRLSIGIAACPINGTTTDAVMSAADEALYKSKERGGNAITISYERIETDKIHEAAAKKSHFLGQAK